MNEEFLYYLWKNRLFTEKLYTVDGLPVDVINPGERNNDSGPDFLYARIKVGDTEWAGNVEIHVNSSDWYLHKHNVDDAYNNVILHVVYNFDKDVYLNNNLTLPAVELKEKFDKKIYDNYLWLLNSDNEIACSRLIGSVTDIDKLMWMERMMVERLETKAAEIESLLKSDKKGFNEVFYKKLARSFGFKVNGDAFEMLASSIPLKLLQKHIDNRLQIESLFYGNAGLLAGTFKDDYPKRLKKEYQFLSSKYNLKPLNPSVWRFMRMRPNNFPTIRISQFSSLLYKIGGQFQKLIEVKRLSDVINILTVEADSYWDNHYRFDVYSKGRKKKVGANSAGILIINSLVPFVFLYGKLFGIDDYANKALDWLEQLPAENNKIVRIFKKLNFPVRNAMHSQAFLYLKNNFCDPKRCLDCAIGQKILNK